MTSSATGLLLAALGLLLAPHVSAVEPARVEFFVFGHGTPEARLHVVSADAKELVKQCETINSYGRFLQARNDLKSFALNCEASVRGLKSNDLSTAFQPSYRGKYALYEYYKTGFEFFEADKDYFSIDVSDVIPIPIWSRYLQGRYYDGVCYNTAMVASGILGLSNFNRYLFAVEALAGLKTVNITLDKQNRSTTFRLGQSPTYEIDTIPTRQSFVITGTNTAAQLDAMMKSIRSNFTPGAMLCTPRTSVYFKVAASTYLNALTLNEWYPKDYRMDDSSLRAFGDRELLEVMQTLNEKGGHCLTFITPDLIVESNGNLPHNLVSSSKAIQLIVDSEHLSGEFSRLAFFYLPVNHERILDWSKKASYFQPSAPYAKLLSMISKAHDILESVNVAPDRPQKGFGLSNAVKNTPSVQAKMQKLYATEFRPLLQDPHFAKYAWATRQAKQLGIAMISKLSQQPAMPKTAGVIETAPYQNLLKRYFDYYSMVFGPGFSEIEFQAYIGLEQMFSDTVVTGPQTL